MSNVIPGKSDVEVAQVMIENDIPFSLSQGYVHFFPDGGQRGQEAQLIAQNEQVGCALESSQTYLPNTKKKKK